ncbi:MAG: methylated-DNA-protein-cysteine methyltransferase [Parcubacteria group bacterium GW2011_GWB1_41_6]|nr:MAG: methylated-DNA-protein-cysteine methyltransferase [Parcubacteria group bacterium GW2011_GWB1_41_6]
MKTFKQKVYEIVSQIPKGKVMSYKEVAKKAGRPKAYRAVGNILNKNPDIKKVPCHRVIRSDGKIGGYAKGPANKIAIKIMSFDDIIFWILFLFVQESWQKSRDGFRPSRP